jgi:hypothetical protein
MPRRPGESSPRGTGSRHRNVNRQGRGRRRRMPRSTRRHKVVPDRDGIPAARVRVRRGSAFPLQAAFRRLAARSARREAVKRPEKQDHHHQANRDVKSPSHLAPRVASDERRPANSTRISPCRADTLQKARPVLLKARGELAICGRLAIGLPMVPRSFRPPETFSPGTVGRPCPRLCPGTNYVGELDRYPRPGRPNLYSW